MVVEKIDWLDHGTPLYLRVKQPQQKVQRVGTVTVIGTSRPHFLFLSLISPFLSALQWRMATFKLTAPGGA
jgi:hypothetical protein